MGTLTMALAAALLAGSAPETVSGEVKQGLDLRGEWEGWWDGGPSAGAEVSMRAGRLLLCPKEGADPDAAWRVADEGAGRLRLELSHFTCLGIYRREGDWLAICFADPRSPRPNAFRVGEGQGLVTLRRVRPRK